jgi:hypothetical protein
MKGDSMGWASEYPRVRRYSAFLSPSAPAKPFAACARAGLPISILFGYLGKPPAPLDPTAFPRPLFNWTDLWAQGLTFGLELQY